MGLPPRQSIFTLVCLLVGFAAGLVSNPGIAKAGPFMTAPCASTATRTQLCDFADPEDMAVIPGTPWIIVSEQGASNGASGFALIDTRNLHVANIPAADMDTRGVDAKEPCYGQPNHYKLGGIGVRAEGGHTELVAIQHQDNARDAVEFFTILLTSDRPKLQWAGCVLAPLPLFLNDVAALPGHGFAATHMFDRALAAKDPTQQKQRFLAGSNTGYVVTWWPGKGWQKVPNSDGCFPNGIDASADGHELYMAETYGHRINAIDIDGSNRREIRLAMQPDNVTVTNLGDVIVAGGTGVPMVSTDGCAKFRPQGCGFPSAVDRVDFNTSGVATLFADDGTHVPGASVGIVAGKRLFVGTSFGNRVTVVPMPPTNH
jgi:hypothetical protein